MQQFETLLLRQLQKQQIRDEFCDTVLHTQGVSVPVHSCVLSAFSPRFYGTLSSMPVPMAGQRRLIELQAVDGCTLLSLVSLLYSGQLQENREQVLSAAQRLGIELPQWEEEERREGKVGRRKAREDADQENKIESGTQTEREEKTDERGAQTDLASSKPQTMYLINPSTCPANQELGSCVDIQDVALPLQNESPSKRRSSGRRRVTPLPPASRSFSTTTTTKLNTVDTSELDLLHTMAPVLVNQIEPIQPIDTLLEDIMTGLHFLPPAETQTIQHGLMSTTTSSSPPILKASNSKPTDPKQHMEGELGDILDHFLRTFDHNSQVGCCGLDVGGETSQGSNKPDSGRDTCSNTSKRFTQQQPYNPHINNQKPQANCLHTSSTLSTQPQSMMNSSVAKKKHVKDGQKRGSKQRNPSRDQNIVQEFENRRLTRSQTKKRKLETALFTHQNPVKRKCNEKERADTRKKRQSDDQKRPKYKAYVDKSGVKKLKDSQKQVRAGERRQRETRFSRNKSVKNRSCRMDDCKQKKSPPKKSLSVGIHWEKNAGNRGLVKHQGFSGAEGRSEEIPEAKDEERINVNGTVKGQERVNYKLKLRQRREDSKRTGDRARQEEMATEESSVPFQLNLPTDTAKRNSYIFHLPKEGIKDTKASISTTESVAKVLDAWPGGPVSAEVKLPFTQSIMLRMTDLALDVGDAPQLASASRLSHAQPRQELLRSLTSVDEEEEDVDVVEVSSTTSELPAVSILEVDLSTEDEVEEDCEIDVLGLDSPCRTASANPGLHTVPRPAEI